MGTPHGRYTSDSPCLNNRIPFIRETIEPVPGHSFLSMDLGQAEYCTWASLSGDEVLGHAFRTGRDFHTDMALRIKTQVPQWNPEDLRAGGKLVNFSILYQMTPFALARKLGCSSETATAIIDAYYSRVPVAAMYIQDVLARAEELGFVETFFGRRRYCPEYKLTINKREQHEIEKSLWSHVNAGSAAEVTKQKQLRVWETLRRIGLTTDHVRLVIQNYDECIWAVRDDVLGEVKEIAEEQWTQREPGFLSFQSTIQTGKTWGEVSK
jgi:DNA polymerase I